MSGRDLRLALALPRLDPDDQPDRRAEHVLGHRKLQSSQPGHGARHSLLRSITFDQVAKALPGLEHVLESSERLWVADVGRPVLDQRVEDRREGEGN